MSVGLQVWSQTAATNSTADTNINWPEGMAPSQVNDSARAMMASMAKWRDDNNGTIVTGGTSTAFTATSNQVEAALTAGYTVQLQFAATADSSATLAVDSLTAKPLQLVAGTNLLGQEIQAGEIWRFTYSTTGTGQWIANSGGYVQTNSIANSAVTYGKIQGTGASVLLGNPTTSTSTGVKEITLGTNLSFSGSVLNAGNNTPVVSIFTSTGTATWQSTTQNGNFPLYLLIRMVGAGGGGAATNTNSGSSGTDTSWGSWTAIAGNKGTQAGAGGAGGSGGVNSTGTLIRRITGQAGAANSSNGSGGGNSALGGGGPPVPGSTAGIAGVANTGGGGSGGQSNAGGGGGEYVEFLITSPSTSYSYTVGGGGAGGAAGGQAGGAGAAGRIEVISYWQ